MDRGMKRGMESGTEREMESGAKRGAGAPAEVTLQLPGVLEVIAGRRRIPTRGHTVRDALEHAFTTVPLLERHLLGADGALRPHVLCLRNGSSLDRDSALDTPLEPGDELLIHQAISGG